MAVHYTNRIGKSYYLRERKTKTGKLQYFFTTQENGKGKASGQLPEGYEIHERPENAQVFCRKIRPQLITDSEKKLVKKQMEVLAKTRTANRYLVDCQNEWITIYESSVNIGSFKEILGSTLKYTANLAGVDFDNALASLINSVDQNYSAMMRFQLVNRVLRTFTAERFCFRGAIDDWIYLDGPDPLKKLAGQYLCLLGTEDFFETPYF